MTPHHTRAQSGFTLLEAIVALVIMATTLMVLYGWLASSTLGAVRSEETAASLSSARTALSYLERVNPMTQPNGTTEFGTFKLTWHAEPVTDRRTGRTPVGDPSLTTTSCSTSPPRSRAKGSRCANSPCVALAGSPLASSTRTSCEHRIATRLHAGRDDRRVDHREPDHDAGIPILDPMATSPRGLVTHHLVNTQYGSGGSMVAGVRDRSDGRT